MFLSHIEVSLSLPSSLKSVNIPSSEDFFKSNNKLESISSSVL